MGTVIVQVRNLTNISSEVLNFLLKAIFQKTLAEANRQGIRLIVLNRRDFPGSTSLSEDDLAPIKPAEADASKLIAFLHERALEIIGFIHAVIKELTLPVQIAQGGAISILGWSLGSMYCFAIIDAFMAPDLPIKTKEMVKECISSVILFGWSQNYCFTSLSNWSCSD